MNSEHDFYEFFYCRYPKSCCSLLMTHKIVIFRNQIKNTIILGENI